MLVQWNLESKGSRFTSPADKQWYSNHVLRFIFIILQKNIFVHLYTWVIN